MVEKFLGGKVVLRAEGTMHGRAGHELVDLAKSVATDVAKAVTGYAPQIALGRIWELVRRANALIEEEKPWVLAKEDTDRLTQVLFDVLEVVRQVAVMTWPFMPEKSELILERIGHKLEPGSVPYDELLAWGYGWRDDVTVTKRDPVFPKYTDEDLQAKFDVLSAGAGSSTSADASQAGGASQNGDGAGGGDMAKTNDGSSRKDAKPMISFDQFQSLEFKLATVLEAEKVDGADKLLKLRVDLGGGDVRQMVAGVAKSYAPDELVGKTILVLANLEPATIRGVESQAMLLAASTSEGLAVLVPDREFPAGTKVS